MAEEAINATAAVVNATNVTQPWVWELSSDEIMDKFNVAADELETGLLIAYCMLVLMAILPIYIGSALSVKHMKKKGKDGETLSESEKQEETEVMTQSDAAMFPVYASGALFGLYCLFKVFGKEYVNLLVGGYFFLIGIFGASRAIKPILTMILPASLLKHPYEFVLSQQTGDEDGKDDNGAQNEKSSEANSDVNEAKKEIIVNAEFDHMDLMCIAVSTAVGVVYLFTKHWLTCNYFGLTLAINAVELLNLGSFKIAATLLSGLFFYDIFWVFGTDVMVTVARSFDAPIKVLFPKDILEKGFAADATAMLGLGDIVLPGVLIALLWRFDVAHGRANTRPYFWCTYIAYLLGLLLTIVIMHTFKAAQPALLYLVPAVLIAPNLVALIRGELAELWAYTEEEDEVENDADGGNKESKKDK